MPLQFTISPDFNATRLSQWFILNNRLQHFLGEPCHLELFDDFLTLRSAIDRGAIDLVYANAFDTALLIREKGFLPVAQAIEQSDEALLAVRADHPAMQVTDLQPGLRAVATNAPDVEMIGRILLEPADLNRSNTTFEYEGNYVLVAKALLQDKADVGFFLKESYEDLSDLIRRQLRTLVSSHIYVVRHAFLASPKQSTLVDRVLHGLLAMTETPKDRELLAELGVVKGWRPMTAEDAEFMIDMINTLLD